jgi:hypothetical protein
MAVLEHLTLMKACMREYLQWPLSWVQQAKATVKLEMAVSAVSEPKTIGDHWILEIVPSAP